MFKKGQSGNPKGKPKGRLNDPNVASLRVLLEEAFMYNRSAAIAKINKMFQGDDMNDFKFILSLKASIEPKKIEHAGDGFRALIVQYGNPPAKAIETNGQLNGHSGSL